MASVIVWTITSKQKMSTDNSTKVLLYNAFYLYTLYSINDFNNYYIVSCLIIKTLHDNFDNLTLYINFDFKIYLIDFGIKILTKNSKRRAEFMAAQCLFLSHWTLRSCCKKWPKNRGLKMGKLFIQLRCQCAWQRSGYYTDINITVIKWNGGF